MFPLFRIQWSMVSTWKERGTRKQCLSDILLKQEGSGTLYIGGGPSINPLFLALWRNWVIFLSLHEWLLYHVRMWAGYGSNGYDSVHQDHRFGVGRRWFWSMDLCHIYPGIRDSCIWCSLQLHAPSLSSLGIGTYWYRMANILLAIVLFYTNVF